MELFSSFLGALIGGGFAIIATIMANHHNLKLQEQQENAEIETLIDSLETELTCLKGLYNEEFGKKLETLEENKALNYEYSIDQDYFTIYSNNCHLIGKIKNKELRDIIVKTYTLGKQFIDVATMYKESGKRFQSLEDFGTLNYGIVIAKHNEDHQEYSNLANKTVTSSSELEIAIKHQQLSAQEYNLAIEKSKEYKQFYKQLLIKAYDDLVETTKDVIIPIHNELKEHFELFFITLNKHRESIKLLESKRSSNLLR